MISIRKLLLLHLIPLICAVNSVNFVDNARRNLEVSSGVNKISKLRLILIGDLKKQNEIVSKRNPFNKKFSKQRQV